MYSEGHKHVTDVKLDSTVVFLDRILLLRGLLMILDHVQHKVYSLTFGVRPKLTVKHEHSTPSDGDSLLDQFKAKGH